MLFSKWYLVTVMICSMDSSTSTLLGMCGVVATWSIQMAASQERRTLSRECSLHMRGSYPTPSCKGEGHLRNYKTGQVTEAWRKRLFLYVRITRMQT